MLVSVQQVELLHSSVLRFIGGLVCEAKHLPRKVVRKCRIFEHLCKRFNGSTGEGGVQLERYAKSIAFASDEAAAEEKFITDNLLDVLLFNGSKANTEDSQSDRISRVSTENTTTTTSSDCHSPRNAKQPPSKSRESDNLLGNSLDDAVSLQVRQQAAAQEITQITSPARSTPFVIPNITAIKDYQSTSAARLPSEQRLEGGSFNGGGVNLTSVKTVTANLLHPHKGIHHQQTHQQQQNGLFGGGHAHSMSNFPASFTGNNRNIQITGYLSPSLNRQAHQQENINSGFRSDSKGFSSSKVQPFVSNFTTTDDVLLLTTAIKDPLSNQQQLFSSTNNDYVSSFKPMTNNLLLHSRNQSGQKMAPPPPPPPFQQRQMSSTGSKNSNQAAFFPLSIKPINFKMTMENARDISQKTITTEISLHRQFSQPPPQQQTTTLGSTMTPASAAQNTYNPSAMLQRLRGVIVDFKDDTSAIRALIDTTSVTQSIAGHQLMPQAPRSPLRRQNKIEEEGISHVAVENQRKSAALKRMSIYAASFKNFITPTQIAINNNPYTFITLKH